jgi:dethiobiotin synthetase/adenosylmethionine--8-amino-7-oxononanoate aminotransferase
MPRRLQSSLTEVYRRHISDKLDHLVRVQGRSFGALIIEPIVMGAGGMVFVDPLFQRVLIDVVRSRTDLCSVSSPSPSSTPSPPPSSPPFPLAPFSASYPDASSPSPSEWRGLPVIFDEVFVGLYRLGFLTSTSVLGTTPDISVLAKILTAGTVPLSVTLASSSIFRAFLADNKADALLHGHSYTAHPIGCAVANTALDLIHAIVSESVEWKDARAAWGALPSTGSPGGRVSPPPPPPPPHRHETATWRANSAMEGVWSLWDPDFVVEVSKRASVAQVMSLGTVLAIQLRDAAAGTYSGSLYFFI